MPAAFERREYANAEDAYNRLRLRLGRPLVEELRTVAGQPALARDFAVASLALYGQNNDGESREYLRRLRERMKDPQQAADADNEEWLREVERALGPLR